MHNLRKILLLGISQISRKTKKSKFSCCILPKHHGPGTPAKIASPTWRVTKKLSLLKCLIAFPDGTTFWEHPLYFCKKPCFENRFILTQQVYYFITWRKGYSASAFWLFFASRQERWLRTRCMTGIISFRVGLLAKNCLNTRKVTPNKTYDGLLLRFYFDSRKAMPSRQKMRVIRAIKKARITRISLGELALRKIFEKKIF